MIAHILKLREARISDTQIARAAGVHQTVVGSIVKQPTVARRTAEKILAVPLNHKPTSGYVPAVGSTRRLRALYVQCHSPVAMARDLGVCTDYLGDVARGVYERVLADFDQRLRALYGTLSMTRGKSTRSGNYANGKGWHGPLAWNNIDDPSEQPDTDRGPQGARRDAVIEQTAELAGLGEPRERIAARIGITWDAIARTHMRAGVQLPETVEAAA